MDTLLLFAVTVHLLILLAATVGLYCLGAFIYYWICQRHRRQEQADVLRDAGLDGRHGVRRLTLLPPPKKDE